MMRTITGNPLKRCFLSLSELEIYHKELRKYRFEKGKKLKKDSGFMYRNEKSSVLKNKYRTEEGKNEVQK